MTIVRVVQRLSQPHVRQVVPGRQQQGTEQRQRRPAGLALCGRRDADQVPIDLCPVEQGADLGQRRRRSRLRPRYEILLPDPPPCQANLRRQHQQRIRLSSARPNTSAHRSHKGRTATDVTSNRQVDLPEFKRHRRAARIGTALRAHGLLLTFASPCRASSARRISTVPTLKPRPLSPPNAPPRSSWTSWSPLPCTRCWKHGCVGSASRRDVTSEEPTARSPHRRHGRPG
jgi:hypothetical protein